MSWAEVLGATGKGSKEEERGILAGEHMAVLSEAPWGQEQFRPHLCADAWKRTGSQAHSVETESSIPGPTCLEKGQHWETCHRSPEHEAARRCGQQTERKQGWVSAEEERARQAHPQGMSKKKGAQLVSIHSTNVH